MGSHRVLVDCGPERSSSRRCSPHCSTLEPENITLVHKDMLYQVNVAFSKIVLWDNLKRPKLRRLKISPIAVVPPKDRRCRLILDLSFPVYPQQTKVKPRPNPIQAGVNDETMVKLAPQEPVRKIGIILQQVLTLQCSAALDEVVMLAKIGLSDGLWWMFVTKNQQVLDVHCGSHRHSNGLDREPGIFLCCATEKSWDIIQGLVTDEVELPPHCPK
jgi:hypothetical protein